MYLKLLFRIVLICGNICGFCCRRRDSCWGWGWWGGYGGWGGWGGILDFIYSLIKENVRILYFWEN